MHHMVVRQSHALRRACKPWRHTLRYQIDFSLGMSLHNQEIKYGVCFNITIKV